MRDNQVDYVCNNFSECHDPIIIGDDNSAIRVYCKECGAQERIGKDIKGSPEHRLYGEWFRRDILQHGPPLFYKYAGAKGMRIV